MWRILYFILPLFISGCSNLSYYVDAINGHYALLEKTRPIDSVISDDISVALKKKLITFKQARLFASQELLLPDNNSYKSYADLGRPYAAWNVIATTEFSTKAKQWCFLVVGCLSYRGYFSKQQAEAFTKKLEKEGYDTYVAGARAYSTLGWFDDPLLNTMMFNSEAARVGIMFHELAHQKIYAEDDSAFNEAFATFVEKEGIKRWFKKNNKSEALQKYYLSRKRQLEFNQLLHKAREKLNVLYAVKEKPEIKRTKKENIFLQLKKDYQKLKSHWQGYDGYDKWMSQDLNNAHLVIVSTYNNLVPEFQCISHKNNNDLGAFYKEVQMISELTVGDRLKKLRKCNLDRHKR